MPQLSQQPLIQQSQIDPTQLTPGSLLLFPSLTQPGRHHRFLLADCRQAGSWQRLLNGRSADNIFTSPVYADRRKRTYGGPPADQYVEWFRPVQTLAGLHLVSDGSFFVNIKAHVENGERLLYVYDLLLAMVRRWGWLFIDDLCWKRQGFPGRFPNRFKNAHEPVFHFARQTATSAGLRRERLRRERSVERSVQAIKFRPENVLLDTDLSYAESGNHKNAVMGPAFDGRTARNVKSGRFNGALPANVIEAALELERLSREELLDMLGALLEYDDMPGNVIEAYTGAHSRGIRYGATFPVALPSFFIQAYSDPGDLWVDPFGGSGTVMQAAEECGRVAYLMDTNPTAAQRTVERMALVGVGVVNG